MTTQQSFNKQLDELCDAYEKDEAIFLDMIAKQKEEILSLRIEVKYLQRICGLEEKSANAIRQAKYRSRKKSKQKETHEN